MDENETKEMTQKKFNSMNHCWVILRKSWFSNRIPMGKINKQIQSRDIVLLMSQNGI